MFATLPPAPTRVKIIDFLQGLQPPFHKSGTPLQRLYRIMVVLAVFVAPAAAQEPDAHGKRHGIHDDATLGTVDFNVSCTADVSDDFDRAVALLHHMQYDEARAAFEHITKLDPACGMAHWGIAMTLFQPLWPSRPGPDALARGWNELEKARQLGIETDREADLVAAAEAFFREPESADWWTRIRRWSEAMSEAYATRPNDMETAAFYALSQLAVGQVEADRMAAHERAGEVLLAIYEQNPNHPGGIHYTIHANDVDSRAGESLAVVRQYGSIAPEVPHALHMPTHIYVRLGEWPDVIAWNRRSADAALQTPAGDAISHHYLHALDYLVYAHLQRGEDGLAFAVIEEVQRQSAPFQGSFTSAFHLAAMPARYAVERRAWEEARMITPRMPSTLSWDQFWWAEAISWFARGLGAAHAGDAGEAERAEERMANLRDAALAAGEKAFADYIEVDRMVLAAWRAYYAGQADEALTLARHAVTLEGSIQKHPVTPGALYPPAEALGDILLALEQPDEALLAYESSLERWPARFNSLLGAARAAHTAGRGEQAHAYYGTLLETASGSDASRPELAEARRFRGE